jgi:hypothetical protein
MKKKDINTFINDKLEQENGIPFKEEYWDSMNHLLDANLPLSKSPFQMVKSGLKGLSKGLKLLYVGTGASLILATGILVYNVQTDTPDQNRLTNASEQIIKAPTLESKFENEKPVLNNESELSQNLIIDTTPKDLVLSKVEESPKTYIQSNVALNNNQPTLINENNIDELAKDVKDGAKPILHVENIVDLNTENIEKTQSKITHQTFTSINPEIQSITFSKFIELSKIERKWPKGVSDFESKELTLLPRKKRHLPFNRFSISAFAGVIMEENNFKVSQGGLQYSAPNLLHKTAGLTLELGLNKLNLKTGLAWRSFELQIGSERVINNYEKDTSYIILNPKYGTTPSGRPYALIKQKIDSSLVSSYTEVNKETSTCNFLYIPLSLQYELPIKRFSILLEGGTMHYLKLGIEEKSPEPPSYNERNLEIPSYQMQLFGGLGLRYAITHNWSIGCQYNFAKRIQGGSNLAFTNSHAGVFSLTYIVW